MRTLAGIGILAIIGAVAAAIFFFGGYFDVGATARDPAIVNWALVKVRMASIDRHADAAAGASLDDPAMVQAGAKAFAARGCAHCHGAPGVNWDKFAEALNPDPPDLAEVGKEREPAQLFWVIKNGIKMTGMPGFSLIGADDREIWSLVAFVKKLPSVSEADYKAWTAP
ncbi:MAG TPA: cytochrome c [Pseudorhodoplanes sp.]|jgi:mono/diheme cytochrome c family protein|nr:cytochrome c [Pseudorhodoplanes sp.]